MFQCNDLSFSFVFCNVIYTYIYIRIYIYLFIYICPDYFFTNIQYMEKVANVSISFIFTYIIVCLFEFNDIITVTT